MGRHLPWKRETSPTTKPSRPVRCVASPNPASARRNQTDSMARLKRTVRSPSTSPPPPPAPPEETFMREGIDLDDKWRMVEDEFLGVARNFTAHLHAAEYQRLKKVANEQSAEAISSISRPVTGPMSNISRQQKDRLKLKARQKDVLKHASIGDEAGKGESPWKGTSLNMLMESSRPGASKLTSATSIISSTRASAGFTSTSQLKEKRPLFSQTKRAPIPTPKIYKDDDSTEESDDDDDDDLDATGYLPRLPDSASTMHRRLPHEGEMLATTSPHLGNVNREPANSDVMQGQEELPQQRKISNPSARSPSIPLSSFLPRASSSAIKTVEAKHRLSEIHDDDDGFGFLSAMTKRRAHARRRPVRKEGKVGEESPELKEVPSF